MRVLVQVGAALLLSLDVVALADEVARVRTAVASQESVWVGQRVAIYVDLMSSTFFSGAPHFDLPSVPGAILMKDRGSPVVSSESVDGETWSIQRHSLSLFAQRAGELEIPAFQVRFSVAPAFGQPPEEQRLTTEAVRVKVQLPPGAEGLSLLIATADLQVEEVWKPAVSKDGQLELSIGDAVTRTITMRARDVPGMVLPALKLPSVEGASEYPQQPIVTDQENRGALTGLRTESTTYVCDAPGQFDLPALSIPWWNTDSEQLERVSLPAVVVSVAENPQLTDTAESVAAEAPAGRAIWPGAILAAALLLGALVWRFRDSLQAAIASWKTSRADGEQFRFAAVQDACNKNDPVATYNALMAWMEVGWPGLEAVTIDAFLASRQHRPQFAESLRLLQRAAIRQDVSWSGVTLRRELKAHRGQPSPERRTGSAEQLPPLNPASRPDARIIQ